MDIMQRVKEHYNEASASFPQSRCLGIFLKGSQNYGIDMPDSDVDTKLIVTPSVNNFVNSDKATSNYCTHEHNEYTNVEDVRLSLKGMRRQDLNALECLFTQYAMVNPAYECEWNRLVKYREEIAHFNPYYTVRCMQGMAHSRYKLMEQTNPTQQKSISIYGYVPKQLAHLLRLEEFMQRYLSNELYADCLVTRRGDFLRQVRDGFFSLYGARFEAYTAIVHIDQMADSVYANKEKFDVYNKETAALLDEVQYNIVTTSLKAELG